jgi:hypothetical protein
VATLSDAETLTDLLTADPLAVTEVVADTAFGSADTRVEMAKAGISLIAPAPPPGGNPGKFTTTDFKIDPAADQATCPAGHTVSHRRRAHPTRRIQFRFHAEVCAACPLQGSCTDSPRGRSITIGPHEQFLQQARADR